MDPLSFCNKTYSELFSVTFQWVVSLPLHLIKQNPIKGNVYFSDGGTLDVRIKRSAKTCAKF